MSLERGFKRIAAVASAGFFCLMAAYLVWYIVNGPSFGYTPEFVQQNTIFIAVTGLALTSAPWVIFYLIRWIVTGFKE